MHKRDFQLSQRLKHCAKKKISKLGLGMTPSCHTLVERMINNGVERMGSQGVADREEQIVQAERNLSRYMDKLSEKAQSLESYPMVSAQVFDDVLREQCPIWPYC